MPDVNETDMPPVPGAQPPDYGFGTFTCKDCPPEANVHPRKSNRGRPPERCDACKAVVHSDFRRDGLNKLRAEHGQPPLPTKEEKIQAQLDAAADNETAADALLRPPPPHEASWLDDDEAQELLRLKNEAIAAGAPPYDPEEHGTVEQYLAGVDQATADYADVELIALNEGEPEDGWPEDSIEPRSAPRPLPDFLTQLHPERANVCMVGPCGIPDPVHVGLFCGNHWQQVSLEDRGILLGCARDSEPFSRTVERVVQKLSP